MIYKEDTSEYEADVTIGNDWELTDAVRDVVTMLKVVFKLHCKIEEFRMTKEDYEELDHITNRLRSMVNDGTISEELMRKLIDIHVKLNPDVLIHQLFNQSEFLNKKFHIPEEVLEDLKEPEEKDGLYQPSMMDPMLPYKVIVDNHQKHPEGVDSIRDLFPKSILKPAAGLSISQGEILHKLPRVVGKSRMVLSRLTGTEIPCKEESKNIYEELEELFVKQNEHIKVLMLSGAGKTDITPLAILDYKSKTSEAVNGYDLMVALDCLIPNLSKEGLEHFIEVANNVLKMKDFDHE